jgi:outer membrane lipoprotein SlyB
MKFSTQLFSACAAVVALVLLSACAASGPNSASARPVLYPNATLDRLGVARGQQEVNACMSRARTAGLAPTQNGNEVGRRAGEGMLRAGAAGAAVGGSAGAMSGAVHNGKSNGTYRNFVHRCLSEEGFEVIGWN